MNTQEEYVVSESQEEYQCCSQRIETLKNQIQRLDKINQIEILKILKDFPNIKLNENKSGVFINLSFLPEEAVSAMEIYMKYVTRQEKELEEQEYQKKEFKETFFE